MPQKRELSAELVGGASSDSNNKHCPSVSSTPFLFGPTQREETGTHIFNLFHIVKESFRFYDENDYECEIFSIVSSARASGSVILAGKRDSRRHSTTSFSESVVVAGTSYQMIEVLSFLQSG